MLIAYTFQSGLYMYIDLTKIKGTLLVHFGSVPEAATIPNNSRHRHNMVSRALWMRLGMICKERTNPIYSGTAQGFTETSY